MLFLISNALDFLAQSRTSNNPFTEKDRRLKDRIQMDQQSPGWLINTLLLSQIAALSAVTQLNIFTNESKTKTAVPSRECVEGF